MLGVIYGISKDEETERYIIRETDLPGNSI